MSYDVLVAGVGGQGTILSSRILGAVAINQDRFVRTGETIGMSQRGGTVVSHIRIDSKDKSAYIPLAGADLLIGFELCEAVRNLPYLKKDGRAIVNTQQIQPVTVSLGMQSYNAEAMTNALLASNKVVLVDGYALANQSGSAKAVNVVLLGAAFGAGFLPFEEEAVVKAIAENVPEKFRALNLKAFELGKAAVAVKA